MTQETGVEDTKVNLKSPGMYKHLWWMINLTCRWECNPPPQNKTAVKQTPREREREKPYLVLLCKQMKREPKRLTDTQGRKSQIKSVFRLRVCYFILGQCKMRTADYDFVLGLENNGTIVVTFSFAW